MGLAIQEMPRSETVKIAYINRIPGYISPGTYRGSMGVLTYEIAHRLAHLHDVIVYARKGRSQDKVACDQGVKYRRISITPDQWLHKVLGRFPEFFEPKRPFFASSLYYLSYMLKVAYDLRSQRCDIVHVHNSSQFIPIIRALNPRIKIVLHMHCEWLTQLDPIVIERRISKADLIIGCSEYITAKIRCRFPRFAKRCRTVYNGVDTNRFSSRNEDMVTKENRIARLLYVGRVSPEKGLHVLLEAFQIVARRFPYVHLDIIGSESKITGDFIVSLSDDSETQKLATLFDRSYLNLLQKKIPAESANRVSFHSTVPHMELISYFKNADILVFPSVWNEPFGMPLIEAMACEIPVVATRSGGMPEIVENGGAGILVERANSSELAAAILRLLQDSALRKSMGRTGRKKVMDLFTWEKIVEALLCYYRDICNG